MSVELHLKCRILLFGVEYHRYHLIIFLCKTSSYQLRDELVNSFDAADDSITLDDDSHS